MCKKLHFRVAHSISSLWQPKVQNASLVPRQYEAPFVSLLTFCMRMYLSTAFSRSSNGKEKKFKYFSFLTVADLMRHSGRLEVLLFLPEYSSDISVPVWGTRLLMKVFYMLQHNAFLTPFFITMTLLFALMIEEHFCIPLFDLLIQWAHIIRR
jgi:hypothetical protein